MKSHHHNHLQESSMAPPSPPPPPSPPSTPPPPPPVKLSSKKQPIAAVITQFLAICFPVLLFSPQKKKNTPRTDSLLVFSFTFISLLLFFSLHLYSLRPYCHCDLLLASLNSITSDDDGAAVPLPVRAVSGNLTLEETEFWRQPDGRGYRPCMKFSLEYRKASAAITAERRRFLVVVVSGGLNQQMNQIVDAVIIARVLRTALLIPFLQDGPVSAQRSEFGDIFDLEYFKKTLRVDIRVVSALPPTHIASSKQTIATRIPTDISPEWLQARFSKTLRDEGLVVMKGLDSNKLSKNLPPDLQKLRCKAAFDALRFAGPIRWVGRLMARRMWADGPYVALHLRLEEDVWVPTGCTPGPGPESAISEIRRTRPGLLATGLCPLTPSDMSRLLKSLGAPRDARLYLSGGAAFGGAAALTPLTDDFPNTATKETLARADELSPYANSSSAMTAVDYLVSLSSNVFIPSHVGNTARAIQGHRTYAGHRKTVVPNKRATGLIWIRGSTRYHGADEDMARPGGAPISECMCKTRKL